MKSLVSTFSSANAGVNSVIIKPTKSSNNLRFKSLNERKKAKFKASAENISEYAKLSDIELIEIINVGNDDVYSELFSRYQKKLLTYIFRLVGSREEAEDILQTVFAKTFKNIDKFDKTRKFSSWIYRIAHNEAVNYLKRKSKRYTFSWDEISTSKDKLDSASNDELPEEKWMHEEIADDVNNAIKALPEKYQQVLKLRYFKELTYDEIAVAINKPLNTVGTLINRAKKKLLEVAIKQGMGKQ